MLSTSLKRFNSHTGTPSTPVAFLGFSCLCVHLTCQMDGKGGRPFFNWDISWTNVLPGLINACFNCFARYSVASAGRMTTYRHH